MTAPVRLAVLTAGVTEPSSTRLLADRLAEAARAGLAPRDVQVHVVEARALAHDLTNAALTGFASPALQEHVDAVAGADGVVAVTPVYNAAYSGLFKLLVDALPQEALRGTPVLLGATAGTARHSLVLDHLLRPLFAHLGAVVVPTAVFAASEDWGSDAAGPLADRITRAGRELADLVVALPRRRREDPFTDVTPFESLLGGLERS